MNTLLIRLTELPGKNAFYIDAATVRVVARAPDNILETVIITYVGGTHKVAETVEEAARLVNEGRLGWTTGPDGKIYTRLPFDPETWQAFYGSSGK